MDTQIKLDKESKVLRISTSDKPIEKTYQSLQVFNDLNPMLNEVMPEFDFSRPPFNPVELAGCLKATMKKYGGIGLAANQCSVKARVFVVGNEDDAIACFNPKIISISETSVSGSEGCLSFPGMFLNVQRTETIGVEYYNEKGELQTNTFSGITARCFQHELDHLNGIKFTSYVGKTSFMIAKKRQDKLKKKFARGQMR
jgi:peptide deformylase